MKQFTMFVLPTYSKFASPKPTSRGPQATSDTVHISESRTRTTPSDLFTSAMASTPPALSDGYLSDGHSSTPRIVQDIQRTRSPFAQYTTNGFYNLWTKGAPLNPIKCLWCLVFKASTGGLMNDMFIVHWVRWFHSYYFCKRIIASLPTSDHTLKL